MGLTWAWIEVSEGYPDLTASNYETFCEIPTSAPGVIPGRKHSPQRA